jgi:hypothetical protein
MKSRTVLCWIVAACVLTCARGGAVSPADFWQKTTGPYGGTVFALVINASRTILAGTSGGVYLSTNNGTSWTPVNTGLSIAK